MTSVVSCGLALPLVNNERRPRLEIVLPAFRAGWRVTTNTVIRAQVEDKIDSRLVDGTTELTDELTLQKNTIFS